MIATRYGCRLVPLSVATRDGATSADLTVAELLVSYMRFAEGYYRDDGGKQTGEVSNLRLALRPLFSVVFVPSMPMKELRLSTSGSCRIMFASFCWRSAISGITSRRAIGRGHACDR